MQGSKSQWGAAFLNFIIPGVGYLYVGTKRQIFSVGLTIASVLAYASPALWQAELDAVALVSSLVFSLIVAIDGYRDAEDVNNSVRAGSAAA